MSVLAFALGVAWATLGAAGFVFWYTRFAPLGRDETFLVAFTAAIGGPLAWGVGWTIHRHHGPVWNRAATSRAVVDRQLRNSGLSWAAPAAPTPPDDGDDR